jgi:hypothetical protein
MIVPSYVPSGAPECFGQIWSEKAVECSGGYDPGHISPNGGHVRPKCDFWDSCKTRVLLKRANERPALIPPQSLIRPPFQPNVPYQGLVPGRPVQPLTPQVQQQYQYSHPQVQMRPLEMMAVSHQMPSYLSEPEVRLEGESYWAPMGREIARGLGKAFGHSIAHFFDAIPFTRKG